MEIGKIPPHDIEAEQAILGCMLTDKDAVISAIEVLKEESFYREDNRAIYSAILSLYSRNEPVDIITVKAELVEQGNFERVGGLEYLAELPERVPTTANVEKYIKIVDEKATLRSLIQTSNELIALGYDESEDVDSIMDMAEKKVFGLSQKKSAKGYTALKDVLVGSFAELEKLYNQKGNVTGITTGFIDLDNKTAGLHNSDLIIIAARPAMGKSAFALNIAVNTCKATKRDVVIFSLEMGKEQLVSRMLASEALVNNTLLRSGNLEPSDWEKIAGAADTLSQLPIYFDDGAGCTVPQMKAKLRRMRNLGLVVIDYIQLMQSANKNASRVEAVSEITRSLKLMAKELNVPVIALSQLSRSSEKRDDKRPILSDLRESGSIEQDADIIMFLYRDAYYSDEGDKSVAECIVAKNRHGQTDKVQLGWIGEYTLFRGLDFRRDDE